MYNVSSGTLNPTLPYISFAVKNFPSHEIYAGSELLLVASINAPHLIIMTICNSGMNYSGQKRNKTWSDPLRSLIGYFTLWNCMLTVLLITLQTWTV